METLQAIFPARDATLLVVILGLPLLGALVNGLFGKRLGREAVTLMALTAVGASFLASIAAFLMLRAAQTPEAGARLYVKLWEWMSISLPQEATALGAGESPGRLVLDVAFSMDALNGTMSLVVTGIGFLIHLYSSKYMEEDPGYYRFFTYLNLFIFSMLVLILGDSLPVLFVGWEGVGLCSYLLIGFWFSDRANAAAGKKAFITNRIGDFGLLVAMALLVRYTGSLSFDDIARNSGELLRPMTVWQIPWLADRGGFLGALAGPYDVSTATLVALALFLGCAGKSAQAPLYVWLPDAMAGPTPVSALIHAATMVTAGVYLVCRMAPVFVLSPAAMLTVALVGAFTALLAATIALVQNDIKKVLAYSTVSQLGYMFMGVGVGAFTAGFFHVVTHAFFKACLFLGAGSVIHAMHARIHDTEASQDVRNMGGLRRFLPVTHATFLVSCLAIAGFPFTSGFFSKDEIIASVFSTRILPPTESGMLDSARGAVALLAWPSWAGPLLHAAGWLGAVMTAFYMFRLYFLTFHGEFRGWKIVAGWKPLHAHGHDAHGHDAHGHDAHGTPAEGPQPHESAWEMTLPLVVLGALALFGGALAHPLEHWLAPVFSGVARSVEVGHHPPWMWVAYLVGLAVPSAAWLVYVQRAGAPARDLAGQFPGLHRLLLDKWRVDELYDELFIGTLDLVADFCVFVDRYVVDGILAVFSAWVVSAAGHGLRLLQTGRVQLYGAAMIVG
ncbi:MAG: NADH-quinone oxidoreductase subunit L, partial [Deltaproteobacteria bacterium]|nr:NADH-quinone oxidoreductase subunit L [Deltaproteobacteria bacterium]